MSASTRLTFVVALLLAVVAASSAGPVVAQPWKRVTLRLPSVPDAMLWRDLDGDGSKELLAVDARALRFYRPLDAEAPGLLRQTIDDDGAGFLFDLHDLDGDRTQELLVVRARCVNRYDYREKRFSAASQPAFTIRRAVLPSRPLAAELVRDLNGDGHPDLVYPAGDRFRLVPGDGKGGFDPQRMRSLPSGIRIVVRAEVDTPDGQLESTFRIPRLLGRDVDGDGHPDLLAQLGQRLQVYRGGAGWTFGDKPTWVLDLATFDLAARAEKDTREVKLQFGRVSLSQDDLDGDGVRDFLVAAGRKVWIFFGGKGFDGFDRPDHILRVGEDIVAVFTADVDDDGRADLVLVKFQMPGMARLVAALVMGIDLRIEALAYRNHGDRTLSRKPDRRNKITFSVPPILGLISDIGEMEQKVKKVRSQANRLRVGDVDGDGIRDVGLRDGNRVDFFRCEGRGAVAGGRHNREAINRVVRDLLFDTRRRSWDIDRLLDYAGDLRYSLNRDSVEGRKPVASIQLRAGTFDHSDFKIGELNGDGRGDLIVTYDRDGERIVDLYLSTPPR